MRIAANLADLGHARTCALGDPRSRSLHAQALGSQVEVGEGMRRCGRQRLKRIAMHHRPSRSRPSIAFTASHQNDIGQQRGE